MSLVRFDSLPLRFYSLCTQKASSPICGENAFSLYLEKFKLFAAKNATGIIQFYVLEIGLKTFTDNKTNAVVGIDYLVIFLS